MLRFRRGFSTLSRQLQLEASGSIPAGLKATDGLAERHLGLRPKDEQAMLESLGFTSIGELID
jgi:hypothetical protein